MKARKFEDHINIHKDYFLREEDAILGFRILDDLEEGVHCKGADAPHKHLFYEMVFVDEADGSHVIDYTEYKDLRNVVFLISPEQTHYWKNVTTGKGILIYFSEEFLVHSSVSVSSLWELQLFREIAKSPAIYMDEEFADSMRAVTALMLKEYSGKELDYPEVLRSCLNVMLIQFYRFHEKMYAHEKLPSLKLNTSQVVNRFQDLVSQNVALNLSVAEYADMLGLNQGTLNAHLKKRIGKSAGQLIRDEQLSEAKRLLVNTEFAVAEISEHMHFQDVAYFCRMFKRNTGYTPSRYRQEFKAYQKTLQDQKL